MNYYEELGIKPDADQEEIRKAHRRLVRLVHPDQHPDPAMKQVAETQMRRLNSIVTTLLDGERRQEYDEQLHASLTAQPVIRTAWRKVPWWIGGTVGAVVSTVGAVWFWADHLGSSFNSPPPVYITPDGTATREGIPSVTFGDPAVGEWVYSPKEPESHKPGFYPPAFISLKLSKNDRGLRGQYKARYEVTGNKPISPDVSFQLTAVDKTSRKFVWEANNGSRGTLAIRSIDGRTMRLEWRTTVFTEGPALTSGIATLERREP
jgi:curved DNA-binding protein CbpA